MGIFCYICKKEKPKIGSYMISHRVAWWWTKNRRVCGKCMRDICVERMDIADKEAN